MSTNTCSTCAHWDKAKHQPKAPVGPGPTYTRVEVPGEWGTCERIIRQGSTSHGAAPDLDEMTDDPAYLSDGSGYFASLTTKAEFGCALYELNPEVQS